MLRDVLVEALHPDMDRAVRALPHEIDGTKLPGVVLVTGVNGTGKTTTTGKLARVLVADGRTVVLGAADTFRAAATEQLATWARAGRARRSCAARTAPTRPRWRSTRCKRGVETGVDAVLVDTAGRLHTKTGLMDELGKVKRVVEKQTKVDEVLLVLDATTGQNGLTQARVFAEVVDITGIVLTKLDGTAKGGIVFQVQRELGVPVKLVGLGEGADDLAPFEPGAFVDALLGVLTMEFQDVVRKRRMVRKFDPDRPVPAGRARPDPAQRHPRPVRGLLPGAGVPGAGGRGPGQVLGDAAEGQRREHRAAADRAAVVQAGVPGPLRRARQGLDGPGRGALAGPVLAHRHGHGDPADPADGRRRGAGRAVLRHRARGRRRSSASCTACPTTTSRSARWPSATPTSPSSPAPPGGAVAARTRR